MAIEEITALNLTDTFSTWFVATNELISGYNSITIHSAIEGNGIKIDAGTNGETTFSINLKTNSGLTFYSDKTVGIDIFSLPEDTVVNNNDYLLIDVNGDDNTNNNNELRKVKASNILPLNINGNHIFSNDSSDSYVSFETDSLFLNSQNILVENSYITLNYSLDTNGEFLPKNQVVSGLKVATKEQIAKFEYNGAKNAWLSTADLGFTTGSKFVNVSDSTETSTEATFTFGLVDEQTFVSLKIQKGSITDDQYWEITTDPTQDILQMSFKDDSSNGENQDVIRLSKLSSGEGGGGLLYVNDKIYIANITGSSQFKTEPTSTFTNYVIPIANTSGILDYRWLNRYVATEISGTVLEGDVVRFTTDTDSVRITRADATTEENSNFIGIVERIYNGKYYVVLSGQFNATASIDLSLTFGETYYLSETAGGVTTTKPSGIAKPVLIATGTKSGILLTQGNGQLPTFKDIYIVDDASTLSPTIVNDTLNFKGGTGIGIRTNSNNEIEIYASGGAGTQNTYATVNSIAAISTADNIQFTGLNGIQIQVAKTHTDTEVEIEAPAGFGIIDVVADSSDDVQFTLTSSVSNDTLELIAGTGITLTNHAYNGITITATGVSVPAAGSVGNTELANMGAFSIKASDDAGTPINVSLNNFPNYYLSTDGSFYVQNSVTSVYELSYGEEPNGGGVPGAIAGFVVGRIVDTNGDKSSVTALNRSDLRKLIGSSPTGYLEENQNAYSIVDVINGATTTTLAAASQTDILTLQSGSGITLTASENTDGSSVVVISADSTSYFASLGSGFNSILTSHGTFNAGDTGAVIEIPDTNTIKAEVGSTDSNFDLLLSVKDASITNTHLELMPANSVKVGKNTTDEGNVDLVLPANSVLGRLSNNEIAALTQTDLNTLLEDYFFDSITIQKINGSSVTVNPDERSGNVIIKEGSYITINNTAAGEITISSSAPAAYGIKTIQTADDSVARAAAALILESTTQNYETLAGNIDLKPASASSRQYKNINISYNYNNLTKTYKAIFEMEPMPASTVKCAGTDLDTNGNYIPTNVYLTENQILGRKSGNNYLSGIDMNYFKDLIGIKSYSKVNISNDYTGFADDYIETTSNNSSFTIAAGYNIIITKEDSSTVKISAFDVLSNLSEDLTPDLGGNLNINNKSFVQNNKELITFTNSSSTGDFYVNLNNTTSPTLSVNKISGATTSCDLILSPYGAGYVQINGGLISSSAANAMTLKSGTGTFNLTNAGATENTLYSSTTANIHVAANERLNFSFAATNTKDLTIEKIVDEVLMYTSTTSANDLVLGSKYNGSASTGTIYLRANVDVDSVYYISNTAKNINIDGQLSIYAANAFSGGNNSVRIKKLNKTIMSYGTAYIDGIPADAKAVIYDILITDKNNPNIKRMFTTNVFNTDTLALSYRTLISNERLSELATTDANIKSLYFTKGATTLALNTTIGGLVLNYEFDVVMTIIN